MVPQDFGDWEKPSFKNKHSAEDDRPSSRNNDRLAPRPSRINAIALLKKGIPIDVIAETSGLSIETLLKLQQNL
jgi:hypothetical protein